MERGFRVLSVFCVGVKSMLPPFLLNHETSSDRQSLLCDGYGATSRLDRLLPPEIFFEVRLSSSGIYPSLDSIEL